MNKRIAKRFRRENRANKGVSTAAKLDAHREAVRKARRDFPFFGDADALVLAASIRRGKR
jgi:hypothetical protein